MKTTMIRVETNREVIHYNKRYYFLIDEKIIERSACKVIRTIY